MPILALGHPCGQANGLGADFGSNQDRQPVQMYVPDDLPHILHELPAVA